MILIRTFIIFFYYSNHFSGAALALTAFARCLQKKKCNTVIATNVCFVSIFFERVSRFHWKSDFLLFFFGILRLYRVMYTLIQYTRYYFATGYTNNIIVRYYGCRFFVVFVHVFLFGRTVIIVGVKMHCDLFVFLSFLAFSFLKIVNNVEISGNWTHCKQRKSEAVSVSFSIRSLFNIAVFLYISRW